jgi:hypothetical protein
MSIKKSGSNIEETHSESSEGDRFASLLDGLLKVPRSEIEAALEKVSASA